MGLWDVPGQARATEVLRGACARAEPGHAWAFVGPSGVGQEQAARALMAALSCPSPTAPGEPCGTCDVCTRCVRGAHPAYHEYVPTGAMHRKEEVREEWLRTASLSALEGDWKVLRVVDADRMNEAAANTFLKGLEEPPAGTIWILDIADPDELPDTILSRCRVLRFAPWGLVELRDEAVRLGIPEGERDLAVRVASGAPAVLRRLARAGAMDDLRMHRSILTGLREHGPGHALVAAHALTEEAKRVAEAVKAEAAEELAALAELYADAVPRDLVKRIEDRTTRREREARTVAVQAALDDLVGWCRDLLLVGAGGAPSAALHTDAAEALRADAEVLGPDRVLVAVDTVLATRESLERNVQQGLALEACFLELSTLTMARAAVG